MSFNFDTISQMRYCMVTYLSIRVSYQNYSSLGKFISTYYDVKFYFAYYSICFSFRQPILFLKQKNMYIVYVHCIRSLLLFRSTVLCFTKSFQTTKTAYSTIQRVTVCCFSSKSAVDMIMKFIRPTLF